jgi:hypothetical protein
MATMVMMVVSLDVDVLVVAGQRGLLVMLLAVDWTVSGVLYGMHYLQSFA